MTSSLTTLLLASALAAQTPQQLDLMAQAKVETDLGNFDAAIKALTTLAQDPNTTPALKAEALVRLGVTRRGAGDPEGALRSFERAAKAAGLDTESKALLVQALGAALPARGRWDEIASRVSFTLDRSDPQRPSLAVVWPDVPRRQVYRGHPVSLDLKEGDLQDVFRLFADVTGLNVVVNPRTGGSVTFKADKQPWDKCLDQILASNGLAYQWNDNVLRIARAGQLAPRRSFSGARIDVDHNNRDLREVLSEIAGAAGATVTIDPVVEGRSTFKLSRVRWDQAFDLIVQINGLDWAREGNGLSVFPSRRSTGR